MSNLHSSVDTPMRTALKQMLREFPAQHHLTLAFHQQQINMLSATTKIKDWYHHISRSLFGRHYRDLPADQRIEFLLLPEGGYANLHFHGLIRVPKTHQDYFERIALYRWRRVALKGTLFFAPLDPVKGPEGWFKYITADDLAAEVLHSSMLIEPDVKPESRKTTRCQIRNSKLIKPIHTEARREPVLTSARNLMDNY